VAGRNKKCDSCGLSLKHTNKKKLGVKRWQACSYCGLISAERRVSPKKTKIKKVAASSFGARIA
jgi:uncharacterized Zn finger protein